MGISWLPYESLRKIVKVLVVRTKWIGKQLRINFVLFYRNIFYLTLIGNNLLLNFFTLSKVICIVINLLPTLKNQ